MAPVTLQTVHKLTTYELRQEIEKRGLIDELDVVNYETLLQKMVQALLAEESNNAGQNSEANGSEPTSEAESLQDRLRREREQRKREAEERSRQRQADAAYFAERQAVNARRAAAAAASAPQTNGANLTPFDKVAAPLAEGAEGYQMGRGGGSSGDVNESSQPVGPDVDEDSEEPLFSKVNPRGFKVYVR